MERKFYLLAGCLLLVFVALGFKQFYLHGQSAFHGPVTEQIAPLVFIHGIGMSAWILFFIAQSSLIVNGSHKLHMSFGAGGAVLAVFLVVVGLLTAIGSVDYNPHGFRDLGGAHHFLIIPLTDIGGFGVLAGIGLRNRRRPEIHRPMMCLATLFVMTAALFRIGFIRGPVIGEMPIITPCYLRKTPTSPGLQIATGESRNSAMRFRSRLLQPVQSPLFLQVVVAPEEGPPT